jgi:predicted O-methyltransferase YrrM
VTRFLKVSEIATDSVKKKEGELLFRLVSKLKPKHMLEMGTSLGISAMYLAKAAPEAQFYTIEGCAAKVEVAKANFLKLDCQNIEVKTGRFDTQLPKVLELMPKVDFAFIDGHSHFKSTLWYFQKLMPYFEDNSTVVIHQIHKNKGMEKAWISIQNMPSVTVTIDLYSLGIIFFNTSLSKQNFVIRF